MFLREAPLRWTAHLKRVVRCVSVCVSVCSYRRGFAGVGRMEAKVVSVCLDFQAVSLISKSQSSPLKADEFEIC